ncbi:hypothetical protein R3P38DRAFT_3258433 [Favolaschia claudopus]|uniref:Uncharacterized protein n=1 Tax=Favolaschia claudopus TaxID=2862362 RepID=A0AAW0D7U3_9AGAR
MSRLYRRNVPNPSRWQYTNPCARNHADIDHPPVSEPSAFLDAFPPQPWRYDPEADPISSSARVRGPTSLLSLNPSSLYTPLPIALALYFVQFSPLPSLLPVFKTLDFILRHLGMLALYFNPNNYRPESFPKVRVRVNSELRASSLQSQTPHCKLANLSTLNSLHHTADSSLSNLLEKKARKLTTIPTHTLSIALISALPRPSRAGTGISEVRIRGGSVWKGAVFETIGVVGVGVGGAPCVLPWYMASAAQVEGDRAMLNVLGAGGRTHDDVGASVRGTPRPVSVPRLNEGDLPANSPAPVSMRIRSGPVHRNATLRRSARGVGDIRKPHRIPARGDVDRR